MFSVASASSKFKSLGTKLHLLVSISLLTLRYSLLLSRFLCRPVENFSIKRAVYSKPCFLKLCIYWQPSSSFKSKRLEVLLGFESHLKFVIRLKPAVKTQISSNVPQKTAVPLHWSLTKAWIGNRATSLWRTKSLAQRK